MRALLRAEIKLHNASVLGNCLPAENAPDKKSGWAFAQPLCRHTTATTKGKNYFLLLATFFFATFLATFFFATFFLAGTSAPPLR
jgi:hypothetical protein